MHFTKQSVDIKLLAVFYINIKLLFCQGNFVNLFTRQGVKKYRQKEDCAYNESAQAPD